MYLAAELERAQLLPAADALAGVFVAGGLRADLGGATDRLVAFWRGRSERFALEERRAFFARLFGGRSSPTLAVRAAVNLDFEPLMLDLTEAIYRLEAPVGFLPPLASEVAVKAAAGRLAENLTSRTTGIPEPTGRMIVTAIGSALELFKHPSVQAALGVRSPWAAVRVAAERYLTCSPTSRCMSSAASPGWLSSRGLPRRSAPVEERTGPQARRPTRRRCRRMATSLAGLE